MRMLFALPFALLVATPVAAQAPVRQLAFEVASVREWDDQLAQSPTPN